MLSTRILDGRGLGVKNEHFVGYFKANRRPLHLLLLVGLLVALCALGSLRAQASSAEGEPASRIGGLVSRASNSTRAFARGSSRRIREISRRRILNFREYKRSFGRKYKSSLEESSRRRVYLARIAAVVTSGVQYLMNKSDTFESINSRSDMTNEERARMRALRPARLVDDRLLASGQVEHMEAPGELAPKAGGVSLKSESAVSSPKSSSWLGAVGGGAGGLVSPGAWYSRLLNLAGSTSSGGGGGGGGGTIAGGANSAKTPSQESIPAGDGDSSLFRDLRQTNCFLPPGDQGACESCASFVAIAQLEFLLCRESSRSVKFSEQFPVDCGQPFGMMGCQGSDVHSLNQFLGQAGLELGDSYAYAGVKLRCPFYDKRRRRYAFEEAGSLKLRPFKLVAAPRANWSKFLEKNIPLHVGVLTDEKFEDYGGGVASSCSRNSGAHGMLLVGEGRESGHDYWLLRNSFGTSWGSDGYFKLNKRANHCLSDEQTGYFQSLFVQSVGDSFQPNKFHRLPASVQGRD